MEVQFAALETRLQLGSRVLIKANALFEMWHYDDNIGLTTTSF